MSRLFSIVCGVSMGICAPSVEAQIQFTRQGMSDLTSYTAAAGMTTGVSAADYDNDGDIDLLVPTAMGTPTRLYRNNGDLTFTEIGAASGLMSTSNDRAALFFDYDLDGDLDALIAGDQFMLDPMSPPAPTLRLFRQDAPDAFVEVTEGSGLERNIMDITGRDPQTQVHLGGMTSADFDVDGDLDLIVTFWNRGRVCFVNNGDGTFTELAQAANNLGGSSDFGWTPMVHDFSGDGVPDLYCAVDFGPNRMFVGDGAMQFEEIAEEWKAANDMNDMGVALCDVNNDTTVDIYITNVFYGNADPEGVQSDLFNVLLVDNGPDADQRFSSISVEAGCAEGDWGWGCTINDFDHDMWPDIAATNGFQTGEFQYFSTDPSVLFRNLGTDPVRFEEIGGAAGAADTDYGSAYISFDVDRDGDIDLLQTYFPGGLRLLVNDTPRAAGGSQWLVIQPRRVRPDGAVLRTPAMVRVTAGATTMTRVITIGTSLMGQEPYEAHFGLGINASVDLVEIEWPGGVVERLADVSAGQRVDVYPCVDCALADANMDGTPDWGAFDADGNGKVEVEDLYAASRTPTDIDADGTVRDADRRCLTAFLRGGELTSLGAR